MSQDLPYIPAEKNIAELTFRSIVLAILLTLLLAMSNAYLALKLGILTSASIPAAIISMGVLRFFKNATVLEHNAVQTAASAGEAVAGGIVYTIPALVIIGYWHHFDYFMNFFIAAIGGILGVLFSIPLRRVLVHDPALKFPEGRAIAEVLKSSMAKQHVTDLVYGGFIGALFELAQVGVKWLASSWSFWFTAKRSIVGLGAGFSVTMIGAGYLVGPEMALSIFIGAVVSWLIAMPVASHWFVHFPLQGGVEQAGIDLWNAQLRYLGIGAMLCAGIWTFIKLSKPLLNSMRGSYREIFVRRSLNQQPPRTDYDIPFPYILIGIFIVAALLFLFFQYAFPLEKVGLDGDYSPSLVFLMVCYVLIIGFLFSVITAYFSGMVGVTASPGSSVVIAGVLLAAWLLLGLINLILPLPISAQQIQAAEAITIIIGSVVTGIAAIANDNTQDLKVGQLVGATPWKQQLMLLIGVIVSALVIPPVMQLLFNVYGIAGVMPRAGMDISQSLPAPTAALLSAVTEAVFRNTLPWPMMLIGAGVILVMILLNRFLKLQRYVQLSILGIAIGMYLPITSSFPLFLGGVIAWIINRGLRRKQLNTDQENQHKQIGTLIACGLVAGSALMDVMMAIPFSIWQNPDVLRLVPQGWKPYSVVLSLISIVFLVKWMKYRIMHEMNNEEPLL